MQYRGTTSGYLGVCVLFMFGLTSPSNAALKDEQKLASGDCGHVTFVVSLVLGPDIGGGKKGA